MDTMIGASGNKSKQSWTFLSPWWGIKDDMYFDAGSIEACQVNADIWGIVKLHSYIFPCLWLFADLLLSNSGAHSFNHKSLHNII